MLFFSLKQEDQDGGQSVGQRKRVKLSSSTKGKLLSLSIFWGGKKNLEKREIPAIPFVFFSCRFINNGHSKT